MLAWQSAARAGKIPEDTQAVVHGDVPQAHAFVHGCRQQELAFAPSHVQDIVLVPSVHAHRLCFEHCSLCRAVWLSILLCPSAQQLSLSCCSCLWCAGSQLVEATLEMP